MFILEYCDDPEKGEIIASTTQFDYEFNRVFDSKLHDLDKFLFLVDMQIIIEACAEDLLVAEIDDLDEFWRINKTLLNFVNAIYGYKEYVNSYEPSLEAVTEKYYNDKKWYRFFCDFRNYVIHQSIIIKDYSRKNRDIFINIDEITERLSEYKYPKDWQRENAKEFLKWLDSFKGDALEIKGAHFLSVKKLTSLVMSEMNDMKDEVLMYAYKKSVEPVLKWMLEKIPRQDGFYKYAFVVDEKHTPELVREPNCALEDFIRRMIKTLGSDSVVCREILDLLTEEEYVFFYDGNCTMDEFIEYSKKKR